VKTVTIDEVLSWKPCDTYSREALKKLAGRKRKMSALQILALKIPVPDRFLAILNHGFLSDKDLRLFACDCAEHVLHFFEEKYPTDKRPRKCIEVARRFALGEATAEEMAAARAAAWAAARDAAWAAARAAARDAAWAAARDAARDAAWAVAWDAAWDAARDAAWAKEWAWQVKRLKRYLEDK
jgi:hypothetical protein